MKSLYALLKPLALTLLLATSAHAQQAPANDIVLKGDARCTSCHDETDAPDLLKIGKTKHGTLADKRTPTCTSCHGESNAHTNHKGKGTPPKPDIVFGKHSKQTAEQKNQTCSSCHQGGKHIHWSASAHAAKDVPCTSCHTAHDGKDKVLNKKTQAEVCYSCHKQQRSEASKPSHHPIPEGKMTCSDCHNAHGSAGDKLLLKDTVNATCFTCHAEKRGPFLHNHQPVVENCMNCHNPHGTSAENMLKSRMPFLCQQCHGAKPHPGNVPGTRLDMPNALSANIGPGLAQARGCVNCHTNIHGSNSPSNASSGGPFRFFR